MSLWVRAVPNGTKMRSFVSGNVKCLKTYFWHFGAWNFAICFNPEPKATAKMLKSMLQYVECLCPLPTPTPNTSSTRTRQNARTRLPCARTTGSFWQALRVHLWRQALVFALLRSWLGRLFVRDTPVLISAQTRRECPLSAPTRALHLGKFSWRPGWEPRTAGPFSTWWCTARVPHSFPVFQRPCTWWSAMSIAWDNIAFACFFASTLIRPKWTLMWGFLRWKLVISPFFCLPKYIVTILEYSGLRQSIWPIYTYARFLLELLCLQSYFLV